MGRTATLRRSPPSPPPARMSSPRVPVAPPPISSNDASTATYSSMLDQTYASSFEEGGVCSMDGGYSTETSSYDPSALSTPSTPRTPPPRASPAAPRDRTGATPHPPGDRATGATDSSSGGGAMLTATLSGSLTGPEGPARPGSGGGTARGRGAGRGTSQQQEGEEDAAPRMRAPAPLIGSVGLERDSFQLSVSAIGYPGSVRVSNPATPGPATAKDRRTVPADMPDYRGEFAETVSEGAQLYDRILAAARDVAALAREQNEQLGRRHQQVLSINLRTLDDRLDYNRTSLRIASDTMLLRLHRRAGMLRMRIAAAAGTAHARLTAKRTRYQTQIDGLTGTGAAIVSSANAGVAAVGTKARAAESALQFMVGAIPRIWRIDSDDRIWNVRNEAIRTYLPPRVERLKTSIASQRETVVGALTTSFACLQCNVDNSQQAFRYATDSAEIPAHRAVDAAASGGRKAVNDAAEQLETAIHETQARGDAALVEQHNAMRKAAIDTAQQQARQERSELADTATRQVASLTAVAGAQAQSIQRVKATLDKDATLPEPSYAGVVSRASKRLSANMAGVAAVHPRTTTEAARRLRDSRRQRATSFDRQQDATGAYSRRSLDQIVEQSVGTLEQQLEQIMGRLTPVPTSVRTSIDSSLQPLDDAFYNGLAEYRDSLAALQNSVDSAFTHNPAAPVEPSHRRPTPPEPPPGRGRAAAPAAPAAPAVPVPGPPASCHGCPPPGSEPAGPAESSTGSDTLVCSAEPNMSVPPGLSLSTDGGGAMSVAPLNYTPAPAPSSPHEFNRSNDAIAANPFEVATFTTFVNSVFDRVNTSITERVTNIYNNMTVMSTSRKEIVDQLVGVTRLQGRAIEGLYNSKYDPDLRPALDSQLRSIWAAGGTDNANVGEAINALNGNASESGFSALTAAFNFSNDFSRARETLLNMTPQQIADMRRDHGAALDGFASELFGQEREIFEALISGHPEVARAIELRGDLDRNDHLRDEERGDANAALVDTALREGHNQAIYSGPGRHHTDIFGFEDPEIVAERSEAHLIDMQTAFGFLPGVIEMGGGTSSDMAGSALFHYATRTVDYNLDWYRRHPPQPGSAAERRMRELENRPNPYGRREMLPVHRLMIEQSLRNGVDSDEARGARLLRERRRSSGNPDPDGMDKALHIGSGDAREGAGYDAARRERGRVEAERHRDEVFLHSERFRYQLEGGNPPPDSPEAARAAVRAELASSYPRDARARAVVLGIVDSEAGDLDAVVEYAAHTENTTLLNRYLGRRDRREIDAFAERYNRTHTISIEKRLGLFEHHWSMGNMNGAVFSGDTANTLEINWMGVPQNNQERGERALRVQDQAIEQAGTLGKLFASEEYDALVANAAALRRAMGVTPDQVDSRGRIRTHDPLTGLPMQFGHFDANGNLRQEYAGDSHAFELAVGMARTSASSYNAATDRIAGYITTALVVAAAIITTALTGGAAASIWIPMLVTAGAGLVGIGMSAAIKGGRYGRDDLVRDLAMTVVQTLTAGIGSAGAIAARGGMPALRMVASRGISQGFRVSERVLERALLRQGVTLAATTKLGADLAIGAAGGALSGGVTAALDPANRGEHFWSRVASGVGRGAVGGAVGAGVARGVASGLGAAGNRLAGAAASRSRRSALASGLSREQAMENALLASQRANWVSAGLTRSIAGGASGSASRMTELGIEGKLSMGEILAEGRSTFIQGMIQGALEHGADPAHRNPFRRSGTQRAEADPASRGVTDPAGGTTVPARAGPEEMTAAVGRRAPSEDPAARPPAASGDDEIFRSNDSEDTKRINRAELEAQNAEQAAALAAMPPDPPRPPNPFDKAPVPFDQHVARGGTSNDPNYRVEASVDLTPEMLRTAGSLPEGSVIRAANPRDPEAARRNYDLMRQSDAHREVLLAYHAESGEYAVVQGGRDSVGKPPGGGWIAERHTHPRTYLINDQAAILHALPSGDPGDFRALITEAQRHAARPENGGVGVRASKIDVVQSDGSLTETTFAVILQGDSMELVVTFRRPDGQQEQIGPFTDIADYAKGVLALTGTDIQAAPKPIDVDSMNTARGTQRGVPVSVEDRAAVAAIAERMGAAPRRAGPAPMPATDPAELHSAVRRLGLVGEPRSLSRLTALINDPDLPPHVGSALASATLDATRAEMIRNGSLAPGDDVVMLFRGVTTERLADYQREGMNLSRLGPGGDEDAGRGLYGSQDLESAARYTGAEGSGGQVLPVIARQSELGNVIDVRSGTPLGERWLQFLRGSRGGGRLWPGYDHLNGQLDPRFNVPMALHRDGRGQRFEAFLATLAADSSLPPGVRAAAADPHLTMMDLGGVASTGNDRGILTDQWAMHGQRIANLFNEAHGFPVPGREGSGVVRASADEGDVMRSNTYKPPGEEAAAAAPARAIPDTQEAAARLALGVLRRMGRSGSDGAGDVPELMRLAPRTMTEFFGDVARAARQGRATTLGDETLMRLTLEMRARGAPVDLVDNMRARFQEIARPDSAIHMRMAEVGAQSGFDRALATEFPQALARRAALEAAGRYGYRRARSPERQLVRRLLTQDPEAVARLISSGGTDFERASRYALSRVRQGEGIITALRDGIDLVRAVNSTGFAKVRDRVDHMLRRVGMTADGVIDLVRARPEALLQMAHTNPEQLSRFVADFVFKKNARFIRANSQGPIEQITAQRVARYAGRRMISNLLPVASEMSVVATLRREMGLSLLKADAAQRGGANRGGLDIVAFGRINGSDPMTGGPVRVMIADDKAFRMRDGMGIHELQEVSAMTGPRFATNLRETAQEITAQMNALEAMLGPSAAAQHREHIAGARQAVRQMESAALEIAGLPVPPKGPARDTHVRSAAYARAVAAILERNNITGVITSRHGNVNALATWMRLQGFILEDEYLRRLEMMARLEAIPAF